MGTTESSGNLFKLQKTELFEELREEGKLEKTTKVGMCEEICKAEKEEMKGMEGKLSSFKCVSLEHINLKLNLPVCIYKSLVSIWLGFLQNKDCSVCR